jgi:hypothetical protein
MMIASLVALLEADAYNRITVTCILARQFTRSPGQEDHLV